MVAPGSDGSVFKMPIFYVFLISLPLTTVLQLKCLNSALANFDSLLVVPIYQASICIIGVVWGWIFYAENKELPAVNQAMFILGCVISVIGICLLGLKPRPRNAPIGSGPINEADLPPEISRTISLAREASMTLKTVRSLRSLSTGSQESQTTHFLAASRPLAQSMTSDLLSTDPSLFTNDEPIVVVVDGQLRASDRDVTDLGTISHSLPHSDLVTGQSKISAGLQDVANAITESAQSARESQASPESERRSRRDRDKASAVYAALGRLPPDEMDGVGGREHCLPGSPERGGEDTYFAAEVAGAKGDSFGGGFRPMKKIPSRPGSGGGGGKTNHVVQLNGVTAVYDPSEAWG